MALSVELRGEERARAELGNAIGSRSGERVKSGTAVALDSKGQRQEGEDAQRGAFARGTAKGQGTR